MKKIFLGILAFYALQFTYCHYIGSCFWTNYASQLKKVAEPMGVILKEYYSKHNRIPASYETPKLLREAGCSIVRKVSQRNIGVAIEETYSCLYINKEIEVTIAIITNGNYMLEFHKLYSTCYFTLHRSGKTSGVGCYQTLNLINMPGA